jgi:hypothetical protein
MTANEVATLTITVLLLGPNAIKTAMEIQEMRRQPKTTHCQKHRRFWICAARACAEVALMLGCAIVLWRMSGDPSPALISHLPPFPRAEHEDQTAVPYPSFLGGSPAGQISKSLGPHPARAA